MRNVWFTWFFVGITAILPAATPYDDGSSSSAAVSAVAAPRASTAAATASQAATSGTYTVKSGDSLWKIAARFLGNGRRYWDLVELNKDRYPSLAKNPNLIYPGWVLRLPGGGSVSSGTTVSSGSSGSSGGTVKPGTQDPPIGQAYYPSGQVTSRSPDFKNWIKDAMAIAGSWSFPTVKNKYGQVITREDYFKAIMYIESHGVHQQTSGKILTSSCGALGFMQLMPATARGLGVDPRDPRQNLMGGAKYLRTCLTAPCSSNPSDTPMEKLIKSACGYNRGAYAKELKNKTWTDYVNTCTVDENVRYGIRMKMCLGLELTAAERNWLSRKMGRSAAATDNEANAFYRNSRGLF